jgi:hypothetical protein
MEKVYSDLSGLVGYLKEKIKLYNKKLSKENYIKFSIEKLEISTSLDYSFFQNYSLNYLEEEIWDHNDRSNFILNEAKSYKDYNDIIYEIKQKLENFGLDKGNPEPYLENFLNIVLGHENNLSNESDDIMALLNDLDHNELTYRSKLFLYGVCLADDITSFDLDDFTTIRRTTKEDFEYKVPLNLYLVKENLHFLAVTKYRVPSVVIETRIKTKYSSYWILSKVEQALTMALRLLNPSRVTIGFFEAKPNSIFSSEFIDDLPDPMYWRYSIFNMKNVLDSDKLNKLKLIFSEYHEILKTHVGFYIFDQNEEKNISIEPIGVALDFYREALLEDKYVEKQIASAVMGIEALILKYSDNSKTGKFVYRCKRLGKLFGITFNDFERVYDLRSKFAHGAGVDLEYGDKYNASLGMLNFCRLLLLLSLELKKKGLEKENLIKFLLNEKTTPDVLTAINKIKSSYI